MLSKLLAILFLFGGLFVLYQVIAPQIKFKAFEIKNLTPEYLVSPENGEKVLGVSIQAAGSDNFPEIVSSNQRQTKAPFEKFYVSIPSLKIDNATAYTDSNDLAKGLAQLPGSALPGEKGNLFISGHSALPILFEGNQNTGAIFANLPDIKNGDKIYISAGGNNFTYQVISIKMVDPKDLSILNPPDLENRYVSLMTCVPPGLNTQRLVVLGRLI